tara:strand:+ start:252 stop:545 length:294 start_codon:yes stop_codon:yes gene_type:complete
MSVFKNLSFMTKTAFVSFILGKLCFLPSVVYLFLQKKEVVVFIALYIFFILVSIITSAIDMRKKESSIVNIKNLICDSKEEKVISVKVKNGKIIEIL